MTQRQTHTYAELELSQAAYDEIAGKLRAAGYDHAFMTGEDANGPPAIDMHGIGVTRAASAAQVVSLDEQRAVKADDARLWTPADALRSVLRDIESGETRPNVVYIAMLQAGQPDKYPFACAGANALTFAGLLAMHMHMTTAHRHG